MSIPQFAVRLLPFAILLSTAAGACAQPNFTGQWKMNKDRSNFSPLPQPDKLVRKITQHGSHLKITTTQLGQGRDIITDLSYTTDGAECKNVIRGQEFTGTAQWDGDTLVVESRREVQGMRIGQRESWSLSGDGRTLTIVNHVETPQASFDITIVFDKQAAG